MVSAEELPSFVIYDLEGLYALDRRSADAGGALLDAGDLAVLHLREIGEGRGAVAIVLVSSQGGGVIGVALFEGLTSSKKRSDRVREDFFAESGYATIIDTCC